MRKRSPIWGAFRKVALTASLLLVLLCAIGWWRSWRWSESLSLWTNAPTREEWDKVIAKQMAVPFDSDSLDYSGRTLVGGPLFSLMHDRGVVGFHSGDAPLDLSRDEPIVNGLHWAAPAEFYASTRSFIWWDNPQSWTAWRYGGWGLLIEPGLWSQRTTVHFDIPYWFVMLLCASPWMLEGFAAWRRNRLRKRGVCIWCGYDLRTLPDGARCPECGEQ